MNQNIYFIELQKFFLPNITRNFLCMDCVKCIESNKRFTNKLPENASVDFMLYVLQSAHSAVPTTSPATVVFSSALHKLTANKRHTNEMPQRALSQALILTKQQLYIYICIYNLIIYII